MRYFDRTFFKFLFAFALIIFGGLFFLSKVSSAQTGLININTASLEELDTLEGVGPVIAQRIIDYRVANGPFETIEEIKNVSGIGDVTYDKIRDDITVGTVSQNNTTDNNNTTGDISPVVLETSASGLNLQKGIDYRISVEKDRVGVVGELIEFRAKHNISDSRVAITWNFGDGSVSYGQNVSHAYEYPGEYLVIVSANILGDRILNKMNVRIVPNTLSITLASPERIEMTNTGRDDISLNGRKLVSLDKEFIFPEDTIIRAGQKISFTKRVTGLSPNNLSDVRLTLLGNRVESSVDINKVREEELVEQILSLQRKQLELKEKESKTGQLASVVATQPEVIIEEKEVKQKTWFDSVKRFFGFK